MLRRVWFVGGGEAALLQRVCERRALAALAHRARAAAVPQRGLAGVSPRQRTLCRGRRLGADRRRTTRCSSRTITLRSWRASCGARATRPDGVLLAHSLAASRTACGSARGGARSCRGCSPTICSRSSSSSDRRNFLLGVRDELDADVERGRRHVRWPPDAGDCRADRRRLRSDRVGSPAIRACRPSVARLFREERLDDPAIEIDRRQRRSPRLHQGHSRAARRASIVLLTWRPELRRTLAFVQVGVPSRSQDRQLRGDSRRASTRASPRSTRGTATGAGLGPIRYRK